MTSRLKPVARRLSRNIKQHSVKSEKRIQMMMVGELAWRNGAW